MNARAICLALAVTGSLACSRIPGLGGGGDAGGEGGATSGTGGGVLGSLFDKSFEGEVTMAMSGKQATKDMPKTLVFGIKSPKVRVDGAVEPGSAAAKNPMTAGGFAFIADPSQKKGWVLMTAQKKAIVIDFDKAKGMKLPPMAQAPGAPKVDTSEPPKIEKTGKKDTVAGYSCEIWKITPKTGNRAEVCVAEGIKWVDLSNLGMSSPELAAASALTDVDHFPLRMISYDEKNVETMRMEATKIEKKKLDDAHFTVPADYQIMDLAAMMGGLGAPGGMPPGVPPKRH